jgi:hypothetical protein
MDRTNRSSPSGPRTRRGCGKRCVMRRREIGYQQRVITLNETICAVSALGLRICQVDRRIIHEQCKIVERRCGGSGVGAVSETDGDAMNLMGNKRHGEDVVCDVAAGSSGADDGSINLCVEDCICAAGGLSG